jgi:hypothetical protein
MKQHLRRLVTIVIILVLSIIAYSFHNYFKLPKEKEVNIDAKI